MKKQENNIFYSDKENFLKKIENFKKDGVEKLHILADFDNTLTKAYVNGKKVPSLVSVLRGKDGLLGDECNKEDTELFKKYYPIEKNPNINIEEKKKNMVEWWDKSFKIFIKYGLTKDVLKEIGKTKSVQLRMGVDKIFKCTNKNNVPLIIISASGIGKKSIEYFLDYRKLNFDNIFVISNDFVWDKDGKAIDYLKPIVHSFNKDETVLENFPEIHRKIKNRKNVLLLGDSLGDPKMVDGFEYDNLIKIGFLNDKTHPSPLFSIEGKKDLELLEVYKENYDIVITGDGDFDIVNKIMEEIS